MAYASRIYLNVDDCVQRPVVLGRIVNITINGSMSSMGISVGVRLDLGQDPTLVRGLCCLSIIFAHSFLAIGTH